MIQIKKLLIIFLIISSCKMLFKIYSIKNRFYQNIETENIGNITKIFLNDKQITFLNYIIQKFRMKAIKRLFSNQMYFPPHQLKQQYLETIRFSSPGQLFPQYHILLPSILSRCQKPRQFLAELIKQLKNLNSSQSLIKMLTLIHNFIVERNYNQDDIKALQDLDLHFDKKIDQQWFTQFYRCYVTYLMKLPELSDVYMNILKKQYDVSPTLHLTHLFRITNTVRVLFPAVTNAINVVGRYQADKYVAMRQWFLILSGELVKVYSYVKYLCDQILRQYRVYNPKDLRCFIQSLPQLELLCDKVEDLLVNKYLKGKKISTKIEFKQEKVAQLQYYLDYQYTSDSDKQKTISVS